MSEEIRELTAEEKAAQEALDQKLAACETEDEAYEVVMREIMPGGDSEELGEDALDLVVGGMSNATAIKIVSSAYWDLCIRKKKSCGYSTKQIQEALKICDRLNNAVKGVSISALKWGLKKLGIL